MAENQSPRERFFIAAAVAPAAFVLYAKTLCGDVFWQDSGLYNRSVFLLGSGVPPGFPGYHLFCYLATMVPGISAVVGMNLFSAVAGAVTAFFIVLLFYEVAGAAPFRPAGAAVAALLYAAAPTIWLQSTTCEVYTLNIALTAATFVALFAWRRRADVRLLYGAAFLYGLACANHPQQAVLLIPYVAFVLWTRKKAGAPRGYALGALALWLCAMSIYLYLPVRSAAGVAMDWGKPRTLYGLYFHITAKEFQRQMFTAPWPVVAWRIQEAARLYLAQVTWAGLAAAAVGAVWLAARRRADFALFALVSLFTLALTVNYPSFGFRAWYFTFYMITALAAGWAVTFVAGVLARWRPAAACAFAVLAFGAALIPVPVRYYRADRSSYPYATDYSANHMRSVSYRAMFLMGEDNSSATGGIEALTTCAWARPDIFFVDLTGNANYFDVFDFGGRDLTRAPLPLIQQRYYDILRGVVAEPGRDYYFLYPYDCFLVWGYGLAYDGLVYRLVRAGDRPRRDAWPRHVVRGITPRAAYLDYWGADAVGDYFYKKGEAYARRDAEAAARSYRLAAEVGASSANVQHNLGATYFQRGEWRPAAAYFRKALDLDPTLSLTRFLLAECDDKLGKRDEAQRELREVLRFDPAYGPARLALRTGNYLLW